jgi:hypothetical protein
MIDLDAIRARHLRPEQMEHRTFYAGHIVIDLADLCDEVERLREAAVVARSVETTLTVRDDERLAALLDAERENTALRAANAELRHEVADLRMLRDEHMIDTEHAHAEGIAEATAAVVAWLRAEPETVRECDGHRHKDGTKCCVISPMTLEELAAAIERGEHRREEDK